MTPTTQSPTIRGHPAKATRPSRWAQSRSSDWASSRKSLARWGRRLPATRPLVGLGGFEVIIGEVGAPFARDASDLALVNPHPGVAGVQLGGETGTGLHLEHAAWFVQGPDAHQRD